MWGAPSGSVGYGAQDSGLQPKQRLAGRSEAEPFLPSPDFPPGKRGD